MVARAPSHRRRGAARALLGFAFVAGCAGTPPAPPARPNVLIVVADTVRGDRLGVNGYARPLTPHLDALAADGTNFSQAITVAPRTWQSFTSILTGLYPPRHGVRFINDTPLAPGIPTIATLLGAAGYDTRSFDRIPFVSQMMRRANFQHHETPFPTDEAVADAAWDWIAHRAGRPFFAFLRLHGGHWPYLATPEEMADLDSCEGKDHTFNAPKRQATFMTKPGEPPRLRSVADYRKQFFQVDFDEVTLRHMIAHYDAEIRRTDATIGRLLDRLRGAGLLADTVVVVTADHGESLGEHGYLQHGPRVDEPVVRVPLVVRLPEGRFSWRDGPAALRAHLLARWRRWRRRRTIDGLVRTVDICPTVLDAAGLDVPAGLDGVSLVPAIRGAPLPDLWAYAETGSDFVGADPELYVPGVPGKHRMIRRDGWELIHIPKPGGALRRLYDLRHDPGERTDVAAEHAEKVAELAALLDSVMAADRRGGEPPPSLTEEQKERLRTLGYL